MHFLQHDNGTGNFSALDDGRPGTPGTNDTGYSYAQALISACNGHMDQNPPLRLAPGSTLTPIRKRIRWVLEGVYFDRNSHYRSMAGADNNSFDDFAPLCIRADSVINIFLAEEAAWPYTASGAPVTFPKTRGYVYSSNQANCNSWGAPGKLWAVVASPWTKFILGNTGSWELAPAVNHELCHLLGLNHPFQSSSFNWGECADAPMNANCWNVNQPATPDCSSINQVSNNLMDYNFSQSSLAPCQIGIMQDNLNSCLASRYVYRCSDCLPVTATFEVAAEEGCMPTVIWMDSRVATNYDWYKMTIDRLNFQGQIVAGTHYEKTVFGQLLGRTPLNAAYSFRAGTTYRVQLATYGYCGSDAVQVRFFTTPSCFAIPPQPRAAAPSPPTTPSPTPSPR